MLFPWRYHEVNLVFLIPEIILRVDYEYIFLDLGGTLTDSGSGIVNGFGDAGATYLAKTPKDIEKMLLVPL